MASRVVTVELSADIEAFASALRKAADALAKFAKVASVHQSISLERRAIRNIGRRQKREALDWFDQHLDRVYADLGLERDPNITRGDQ